MWRYEKISNQLANKGILVTQMHCILKKSISERGTQVGALVIGNLGNYKQHDFRTNELFERSMTSRGDVTPKVVSRRALWEAPQSVC